MRFVQLRNPKNRCYVLVDRVRGVIVAISKPDRPFHRIKIYEEE